MYQHPARSREAFASNAPRGTTRDRSVTNRTEERRVFLRTVRHLCFFPPEATSNVATNGTMHRRHENTSRNQGLFCESRRPSPIISSALTVAMLKGSVPAAVKVTGEPLSLPRALSRQQPRQSGQPRASDATKFEMEIENQVPCGRLIRNDDDLGVMRGNGTHTPEDESRKKPRVVLPETVRAWRVPV